MYPLNTAVTFINFQSIYVGERIIGTATWLVSVTAERLLARDRFGTAVGVRQHGRLLSTMSDEAPPATALLWGRALKQDGPQRGHKAAMCAERLLRTEGSPELLKH